MTRLRIGPWQSLIGRLVGFTCFTVANSALATHFKYGAVSRQHNHKNKRAWSARACFRYLSQSVCFAVFGWTSPWLHHIRQQTLRRPRNWCTAAWLRWGGVAPSKFYRSGVHVTLAAMAFAVSLTLLPGPVFASLVIVDLNSTTKENLANIVIGSGITISNVTYRGDPRAAGTFSGGEGIIGIDSGILLSSGKVVDVVGPNASDSTTTSFDTAGDADLETLAEVPEGGETFDAAVLEFDFEANGPFVQFRYVFVSEEYNEFSNSPFNNVFGFFINDVNVALLPGSTIAVAINNVNGGNPNECINNIDDDGDGLTDSDDPDCSSPGENIVGENNQNSAFYIDNDCTSTACSIDIEADGLTVVLTITAVVDSGTNHIKLAIADSGDSILDSWVFIEAESFVPANNAWTNAQEVILNSTGSATGRIDNPGTSRWYRFAIQPGAQATIELTNPPADFDLAVFKDIARAFVAQVVPEDTGDLDKLNAEFAPSAFSPSAFSPSAFSPSAFSPSAFSPSAFSPDEFSPSAFSPSAFSPSAFSPSAFSPSAFSPSAFSPSAFSPSAFSPSAFSPELSPSAFSDAFVGAQVSSLIAVSAGTGTERVIADTWNNTGYFYVRVTGKNGAFDAVNDFQLSIDLESGLCEGVVIPDIANEPNIASAGSYETIILWDSGRIPGNSMDEMAALDALGYNLNQLAGHPEVNGVVVDLEGLTHIQYLHTQANDLLPSCPFAVNLTAQAIKRVIDDYRVLNPGLKYVVIAGGDGAVPFFRYPDQALLGPEAAYDPPVADSTISQGSLRTNHVLGQDEYGAEVLSLRDGKFPVPDLAVGRLVESASEMNTLLDAYLAPNGDVITPTSTLVTGYDFLEDTANAIHEELVAGTTGRNDTLITAADVSPADPRPFAEGGPWTADDLRRELLDEGEDIIFLAGHFSANSALSADYQTILVTTELVDSDVDLTNSLVYSAGCHSGYNIVDGHVVPGVTLALDWPQAFARKGATLVAGTGYQYGDTDFIEYSERLYLEFTRQLRTGEGPVSIGQALVKAKQRYLAETPDIRGLHRKSVLISTLFGLPMLRIDMPGDRLVDDIAESVVELTDLVPFTGDPGQTLGLQSADVAFDFTKLPPDGDGELIEQTVVLDNIENGGTLTATYLEGPDGVVTNPAEPALPLVLRNVTVNNFSARGIGFRGGSWTEQSVLPLTGAPTTEIRGVHIPFSSPVNYPMRFATLNYLDAIAGNGNTFLLVTPAQHRVDNFGDIEATLRQFDDLLFRLFYSNNTQTFGPNTPARAAPPSMSGARAVIDGDDVIFLVNVVGDPAAGIQSVWVTFTDGSATEGVWTSLDLTQDSSDSTLWRGQLDDAVLEFGRLDVMFQAVNGVGLVSFNDNYGAYFQIAGKLGEVGPDGTSDNLVPSELTLTGPISGVFGDEVTLQATLTSDGVTVDGASVLFTLGLSARGATTANGFANASLRLTPIPGDYKLAVSFDGDDTLSASSAELLFTINKARTLLTLSSVAGESGISATLTDEQATPLLERTVYFTAIDDSGDFLSTIAVITDNTGRAQLGTTVLPPHEITARFLGEIPTKDEASPLDLVDPIYESSYAVISDTDGDSVYDDVDHCEDTTIPESVPMVKLKPNHWALTDDDYDFDTVAKGKGKGPGRSYNTTNTVGCSCAQIIEKQGLGQGHTKFGCSIGVMDEWVELGTGETVESNTSSLPGEPDPGKAKPPKVKPPKAKPPKKKKNK